MPLDRFPCAARRDGYLLVVVAGRTSGRKGVTQPEIVADGDRIGDVGKSRGAFVGGHHQIGIILVVAHHTQRRDRPTVTEIVGDIQQRRYEQLVSSDTLPLYSLTRSIRQEL